MAEHNHEDIGAFCSHDSVHIDGAGQGPLAGLTFAAKDIFDIAGRVCCCGNPDWLATHEPAARTAPAVQALLDAGATLNGMTITEELVMGLTGENPFYGTPVNVAAPGRVCGGSSSGSASAVAAKLVDFALGSDTGGSVRVPASFCGIYGLRPSHGRISLDGVMPFAPSLDTVGWFAREAELMARVGAVLLGGNRGKTAPRGQLLIAKDAFAVIDDELRAALMPAVEKARSIFASSREIEIAGAAGLEDWSKVIAVYREYEGWQSHRAWIEGHNPKLSDNGAMRMKAGAAVGAEKVAEADAARLEVRRRMDELLGDGAVLALPAAPGLAPTRGAGDEAAWAIVGKNGRINAAAALAGLPQISLPAARVNDAPIGLGLIGRAGADEALLEIAAEIEG